MIGFTNHKKTLLGILLSICFFWPGFGQIQSNSRLAFEYYNDGEWAKAAPLFMEIYSSTKAKAYLTYYTRCLIELKEFETIDKELRKVLRQTNDITLYIDLAYIYELQNNRKKAEEYFERPFKEFPNSANDIRNLGNSYASYRRFDEALRVYEIGRSLLKMPDEFRMEVANLYGLQHRHPEMIDEYLALLLSQPNYLGSVENFLTSALTRDIDKNLLDLTQEKTLSYIRQFPGLSVFTELLIWVYIQKNDYDLAVDQAISLDIRNKDTGIRTLGLARTARQAGDYQSAIRAFDFIVEQGPGQAATGRNRIPSSQSPYVLALIEKNSTILQSLEDSNADKSEFEALSRSINESLQKMEDPLQKALIYKDLAYLNTFHLANISEGLIKIDSAIILSAPSRDLQAECYLDKADFLMISGDPWEASFVYSRVDKENKNNPIGALAKFRKAQLAYFTQDFKWALIQLNVLKGSSSKLIANDAFELAMLIKENQAPQDTMQLALQALSRAHYLNFQKKPLESILVLDSLIHSDSAGLAVDDALYLKAEILSGWGQTSEAKELYQRIADDYKYEIWGHKALFSLSRIQFEEGDLETAAIGFEELVTEFPNSFYNLDARNYLRKIESAKPSKLFP